MSISVITPHFNGYDGLLQVYKCLLEQTQASWQWVIVDDFSDPHIREKIQNWHQSKDDDRIKLIFNAHKSNASVCRNLGADNAVYENLVFFDSDDSITLNFIANRQIDFNDFAVFGNYCIVDENDKKKIKRLDARVNLLQKFLQAQFLIQTTCILWHKDFFNAIGQFNPKLPRLQDVELAIRAMQNSSDYMVVDNEVDFYYNVKPIRLRKNFLQPVCDATYIFIDKLLQTQNLTQHQLSLLSGYYFMCTKYLERSESRKDAYLVYRNLNLFYKKGYVGFFQMVIGVISLKLYEWQVVSGIQFLRVNRHVFKPKN